MLDLPVRDHSGQLSDMLARKLSVFESLNADDEALMNELCATHQFFPRNTDIVSYGRKSQDAHIILAGMACRYKILPDGSRQVIAFLIPGDMSNFHLEMHEEMDHSIASLGPTRVATLDGSQLAALLRRSHVRRAMLAANLAELAILREWLVTNGRRRALASVAHLLLELYLRHSAMGLTDGNGIPFPLTQKDLADATSVTHIHTNRNLRTLREMEVIEVDAGKLHILNPTELAKIGEFEPDYLMRLLPSSRVLDEIGAL